MTDNYINNNNDLNIRKHTFNIVLIVYEPNTQKIKCALLLPRKDFELEIDNI